MLEFLKAAAEKQDAACYMAYDPKEKLWIFSGAGSCYGRGQTPEEAVDNWLYDSYKKELGYLKDTQHDLDSVIFLRAVWEGKTKENADAG